MNLDKGIRTMWRHLDSTIVRQDWTLDTKQHPVHPELVLDNRLYALARYARWQRGGDVAPEEPGTPARGHLANGRFVYYKYQLATQVDKGQVHLSRPDRPHRKSLTTMFGVYAFDNV